MLRRRLWLLPLATLVVAGAVTGGVVLAQGNDSGASQPKDSVLERVAELLDIDPSVLKDAFEEARGDLRAEGIDDLIEKLVADGRLTEEEAGEVRAWLDARPEALAGLGLRGLGPLHHGGSPRIFKRFEFRVPFQHPHHAAGELSDEDADAILAWIDQFPASLSETGPEVTLDFLRAQVARLQAGEEPYPPGPQGLVEAGQLEEAQLDDLREWWANRPDAASRLLPRGFGLLYGGGFFFHHRDPSVSPRSFGDGTFRFPHFSSRQGFRLPFDLGDLEGFEPGAELFERFERFSRDRDFGGLSELFRFDGIGRGSIEFRFGTDGETYRFEFPSDGEEGELELEVESQRSA